MTDSQLQRLRTLFPITRDRVYFNNAGTGPLPSTGVQAIREFAERASREGEVPYAEAEVAVEETRGMVARLMHVTTDEIAFAKNTSAGIILAIGSIDWRPGDNVVIMSDAFPANSYPFHYLLPHIEKRYVTSGELSDGPDCVFRLVDRRTRAVSLDWVHSLTGIQADLKPIAEFCRAAGVRFIVDAIQGLGVVDMDFTQLGSDFACASVAKWLLAPQGIAILYVNRATLPKLRPFNLGWLSARWEEFNDVFSMKQLKDSASRYEEGTKNYLGIYGLRESLKLLLEAGIPSVERHVRALVDALRKGLARRGFSIATPEAPARSAGIITCFKPGEDMKPLHERLTGQRMVCARRENCLRIAPHFYNTPEEVLRFLEALGS